VIRPSHAGVCIYVYIYMHEYMCLYIHICIYAYIFMYEYVYIGVKRPSHAGTPSLEDGNNDTMESANKSRRSRKAKPLVSTGTGENTEGGECAQS
jgi:hypothetical protein